MNGQCTVLVHSPLLSGQSQGPSAGPGHSGVGVGGGDFSSPPVIHASNPLCTVLLSCAISHRQTNVAVRKIYTRKLKVCKGGKEIFP